MTKTIDSIFKRFEGENIAYVIKDFEHQRDTIYINDDDFDTKARKSFNRQIKAMKQFQKENPGREEF